MSPFTELTRVRITVDPEVRERHLVAISSAIQDQRRHRFRRFRLLAVAAVLVFSLPVLAFAAEDSVPGDLLYPVKLMFEPVVGVVFEDVEVDRRVREVELLSQRGADPEVIRRHIENARDVVVEQEHPVYIERIDRVEDDVEGRSRGSDVGSGGSGADEVREVPTNESSESVEEEKSADEPARSTTTTVPIRGGADEAADSTSDSLDS